MNKDAKIYIAGHRGLVGSAILKKLKAEGFSNFVLKTHAELDLIDANAVASFFAEEKPEYVFLAAAKVGGIVANNTYRADFIYANLMIQNNIVHQSYVNNVKKLLFLGSTCIYPKECPQPMKEDYLLTDTLEYTNEPYAIAKIAGIKLCESYNLQYGTNFISVMPTNLYGPNDNFDLEKSHVLPALIRKMHLGRALEAQDWDNVRKDLNERPIEGVDGKSSESDIYTILEKYGVKKTGDKMSVEIWGSGKPMREFLWSEDMADACIFIMKSRDFKDTYDSGEKEIRNTHINIGTGKDLSIRELAESIKNMVGFEGSLNFNADKPDGTMKKLTDVSKLHGLGWKHSIDLKEGIEKMYSWYRSA
ncbi:GDP-L-fucose synthase family protein [Zobellia barbeyronii]|uniref:GDP-L-fucose synthase n=1 Tax=Zobellia barbeyronii TaxID=2748009 RepID=A0ABS5WGL1_9FLAO|nr:GDP-L-fucose synthase [Zobellia barbeyronii]MBT2161332.1 GDP-L-fucose synthase [Zobellia barbeyronii]